MASLFSALGLLSFVIWSVVCLPQPIPRQDSPDVDIVGTTFLDHESPIAAFSGKTFLRDNIPFIDIPDQEIQDVYYYRWTSLQRNLRYVMAGIGWMFMEFVQPVWYAKAFGSIDAAAGHQIDESRWLRSHDFGDDYSQLYTRGPADTYQYTQWILDAMSRRAMVTGNQDYFSEQLEDMVRVWNQWDTVLDDNAGLYYYQPVWDAQELSLPGLVADANNTDWDLRKDGPDTFRPSHNAYMVANARAIARAARLSNDGLNEDRFNKLADSIEGAMYKHMWAPKQQFFMDIIRPNNPDLTPLTWREQVGVFPYRFGIGMNETYAQPAIDALFDPQGFLSEYGPTTLEIRSPYFNAEKPIPSYCCWWNGMSWPFSTGHTLKSMAAIYRAGITNLTADQYVQYLHTYALTQQKDGHPYVAESHYPLRDGWAADSFNHSEHYDHSTNNDDVITGLLGIIPQAEDSLKVSPIVPDNWTYFAIENLPYHGHLVTVLYDADGSRYGQGDGLTVFVNGKKTAHSDTKDATVKLPSPVLPSSEPLVNIAANPVGPTNQYPKANATYTNAPDYHYKAIDGVLYYDHIPNNRWTDLGTPNANDTLTVTFARPRKLSSVTIALYSDTANGGIIGMPSKVEIYGSQGLLATESDRSKLLANDRTTIEFDESETTFIAVNLFRPSEQLFVGLCEVEAWTAPSTGPDYFAVDAYITGETTAVVYDQRANGTSTGSVVGDLAADSNIAFAGIRGDGAGKTLKVRYSNAGARAVSLSVEVNQKARATVSLPPTNGAYSTASVAEVPLGAGKNYVSLRGGPSDGSNVRVESLTVVGV